VLTTIFSILFSFAFVILIAPLVIRKLKSFQFGQNIREDGPASHHRKRGTPTIGGILFIPSVLLGSLFFVEKDSTLFLLLLLTCGYGLIGFLDDFIKIHKKRNLGLTARQKLACQTVLFLLFSGYLYMTGFSTVVSVPGTELSFDFGIWYYVFLLILVVGTTNATNLTDGLDGLLSGSAVISFLAYAFIGLSIGNESIMHFSLIFAASLLGFLLFNHNPARIFMGDTGSLAIGGAIAGIAILTKTELLLVLIGGVYVAETLSVIIQVLSFKTRGKRIFKMTPIHHHFELSGWNEWKVVIRFWLSGAICSLFALALLF
jgi:phospho-N-acetylmuramoyl-pentapeptide-transferase